MAEPGPEARPTPALRRKAVKIQAILDALYPQPPIPLNHMDPFSLLVAVVLSAQNMDSMVNRVTPALMALGPTPAVMAALPEEVIYQTISRLGLARGKARALKSLSRQLVERHDGRVPPDHDALVALPGVGHKTASVVLSQAFGQPAFPVDTHIHRLAARWGLSDGSTVVRTERDLKALYLPDAWNRLHLQMIYFGREHCPARRHDLDGCPICAWAASHERKAAERAAGTGKGVRNDRAGTDQPGGSG